MKISDYDDVDDDDDVVAGAAVNKGIDTYKN